MAGWLPLFAPASSFSFPAQFGGSDNVTVTSIDASGGIISSRDGESTFDTPYFIQVSASAVTAVGTSAPAEDLEFSWDFGDPGGTETTVDPTDGATVNLNTCQTGMDAAYVYRTAGPYTITLRIRGKNGASYVTATATKNLNVTAWSPTTIVWMDSTKTGGANNGTSAANAYYTTTAANAGLAALANGVEVRVVRGSHFTGQTGLNFDATNNAWTGWRIWAYGSGARPIIEVDGQPSVLGGDPTFKMGTAGGTKQDMVFQGIDFVNSGSNAGCFGVSGGIDATQTKKLKNIYADDCTVNHSFDECYSQRSEFTGSVAAGTDVVRVTSLNTGFAGGGLYGDVTLANYAHSAALPKGVSLTGERIPASFSGTISGNTLTVGTVTGFPLAIGQTVYGGTSSQRNITAGSGTTWTLDGAGQSATCTNALDVTTNLGDYRLSQTISAGLASGTLWSASVGMPVVSFGGSVYVTWDQCTGFGMWKCSSICPTTGKTKGIGYSGSAIKWSFYVGCYSEGAGTDSGQDHHYYPDTRDHGLWSYLSFGPTGPAGTRYERSYCLNLNWDGIYGDNTDHQIASYNHVTNCFFQNAIFAVDMGNRTNNTNSLDSTVQFEFITIQKCASKGVSGGIPSCGLSTTMRDCRFWSFRSPAYFLSPFGGAQVSGYEQKSHLKGKVYRNKIHYPSTAGAQPAFAYSDSGWTAKQIHTDNIFVDNRSAPFIYQAVLADWATGSSIINRNTYYFPAAGATATAFVGDGSAKNFTNWKAVTFAPDASSSVLTTNSLGWNLTALEAGTGVWADMN